MGRNGGYAESGRGSVRVVRRTLRTEHEFVADHSPFRVAAHAAA